MSLHGLAFSSSDAKMSDESTIVGRVEVEKSITWKQLASLQDLSDRHSFHKIPKSKAAKDSRYHASIFHRVGDIEDLTLLKLRV